MKVWIVGKVLGVTNDGLVWEFIGVFNEESKAISVCTTRMHFIGPALLNEQTCQETIDWPGSYYPMGIEKRQK